MNNQMTIKLSGRRQTCTIRCLDSTTMIINPSLMIFSLYWLNMDTMSTSMAMSIYKIMETSQPKSILIITVTCKMTCLMITKIAGAAESGSLKVDLPKAIENLRLIKVILSINLQLVPLENILTTSASLNTIRPKATLSTQRTNSLDLPLLQSLLRNST